MKNPHTFKRGMLVLDLESVFGFVLHEKPYRRLDLLLPGQIFTLDQQEDIDRFLRSINVFKTEEEIHEIHQERNERKRKR